MPTAIPPARVRSATHLAPEERREIPERHRLLGPAIKVAELNLASGKLVAEDHRELGAVTDRGF
jgi:hypothetical protein